jgi:hypothetical protein
MPCIVDFLGNVVCICKNNLDADYIIGLESRVKELEDEIESLRIDLEEVKSGN